jgi:hypothetical protein
MQSIRSLSFIFSTVLLLAAGGCGDDDKGGTTPDAAAPDAAIDASPYPREGVILVDHYKVPCTGVGPQLCLRVTELDATAYENFYDDIEGFDYQWGHRYELRVEASLIEDPPEDGPWLQYRFIETLDDETIDENFEIELSSDFVSGDPASGTFSLLDEREITCNETAVCDAIDVAINAGDSIIVELGHPADPADPLIAYSTR